MRREAWRALARRSRAWRTGTRKAIKLERNLLEKLWQHWADMTIDEKKKRQLEFEEETDRREREERTYKVTRGPFLRLKCSLPAYFNKQDF